MTDQNKTHTDQKFALPAAKRIFLFLLIALAGFGADIYTKNISFSYLDGLQTYEKTVIPGVFNLVKRENPGAAWSTFLGKRTFLISISVVALAVILFMFFTSQMKILTCEIALALFTAGILGNLYDRIFNDGKVRDFLDFYINNHHWPAFNLADSMLCIAVGILLITNILSLKTQK